MKKIKFLLISLGWTSLLLLHAEVNAQESPGSGFMVRTTGALPFLEYGPGDDRLGGAKMTYLDSQVLLRVVDSLGGDYIVRLSDRHRAYISKSSVRQTTMSRPIPAVPLSGSIRVHGDDRYDYVRISLPEKLPYRSLMRPEPNRLVVDIYGVTSNTNWLTQLRSARVIRNTWYEQIEDDVLRVYIDLQGNQHWGHLMYYDSTGNRLVVRVRRPPVSKDIRKLKIAIDAGHGGTNTGAAGTSSRVLEKDYTLLMAKELEKTLRKKGNRNLFMTRTMDTTLDMPARILALRAIDPDLMVSIHLNSSSVDSIRGTSTFYRHIGFRPLSQAILKRMLELGLEEYGNVGHFNFALSGPTEYPNCLVEVAFLSNEGDERRILQPRFHRDVARKITEGIQDWIRSVR
jgi:N-acetylmuramoyl-L-alanine amidase